MLVRPDLSTSRWPSRSRSTSRLRDEVEGGVPVRAHEAARDRNARAVLQADGRDRAPVAFEVVDAAPLDDDSGCRQLGLFHRVDDIGSIGEHREVVGPARDEPGTGRQIRGLADEGERAILQLPRVAGRAAEERHAVERAQAGDRRKGFAQARRDQGRARGDHDRIAGAMTLQGGGKAHAACGIHRRSVGQAQRRDVRAVEHSHGGVGGDLGPRELAQFERRDAVAGQEAVRAEGRGIAGAAGIDHQHRGPGAGEVEGCRESGRTAADDQDVDRRLTHASSPAGAGPR